jgi:hypothetical protein
MKEKRQWSRRLECEKSSQTEATVRYKTTDRQFIMVPEEAMMETKSIIALDALSAT